MHAILDSWKGYSALDSIALRSSISILHRLIAQLLLLSEAISQLEDRANEQFKEITSGETEVKKQVSLFPLSRLSSTPGDLT